MNGYSFSINITGYKPLEKRDGRIFWIYSGDRYFLFTEFPKPDHFINSPNKE
jgi:hypothetical protein